MGRVLLDKCHSCFDGLGQVKADLRVIDDLALVHAFKAPCLNPGIGEVPFTVDTEEQNAADRRNLLSLMHCDEPQGFEIAALQGPHGLERLGSCSEVNPFRVQVRHCLFVVGSRACEPAHGFDHGKICLPVCRAHTYIRTVLKSFTNEEVGSVGTRVDLDRNQPFRAPRQDLDLWDEARRDVIGDQACETFFKAQWVCCAQHVSRLVLHSDQENPAGRICESSESLHDSFG